MNTNPVIKSTNTHTIEGFNMSKDNGIVVFVLRRTNYTESKFNYYVNEMHALDSTLRDEKSLLSWLSNANVFVDKEMAMKHAALMDEQLRTEYGVCVYDGFNHLSYSQMMAISVLTPTKGIPNDRTIH